MIKHVLPYTSTLYDKALRIWQHERTHKFIGVFMVYAFLAGLIMAELAQRRLLPSDKLNDAIHNHFFAVEFAFTLLLLTELLALIFVMPRSISIAVGKQFEILSLILIRSAFKKFSKFEEPISWSSISDPIFHMMGDAFGAIIVFVMVGFYYNILERNRLTENLKDQKQFKAFKKLIALILLVVFVIIGFMDIWTLFHEGIYVSSFNLFYTVLIFCDIMIVLVALRYTFDYFKIFRYSAFVLTTVFIRISLTAPPLVNALMGIVSATFVICMTLAFNRFNMDDTQNENE